MSLPFSLFAAHSCVVLLGRSDASKRASRLSIAGSKALASLSASSSGEDLEDLESPQTLVTRKKGTQLLTPPHGSPDG